MSDPNQPIEYIRAAVDDATPIGFTSSCEERAEQIVITLRKGTHSMSFTLPANLQDVDSDGMADALRMPMEKARRELLALDKPKKKRKAKKAKRKVKKSSAPAASRAMTSAAADAEASAASATHNQGDAK
jgi:hypothetical protein